MMRAHKEYTKRRKEIGPWDYINNKENIDKFFREGLERNKHFDNIITIGMRGDGDSPWERVMMKKIFVFLKM